MVKVEVEKRIRIHEDGKIVEIVLSIRSRRSGFSDEPAEKTENLKFIELIAEPQVG
jgi:hypothetical protein